MNTQLFPIPVGLPVGPLYAHITTFVESLTTQGYASYTVDQKLRLLIQLDQWLQCHRVRIQDFSEMHIQKFLRRRRGELHGRGGDLSTLRSLLGCLHQAKIVSFPLMKDTESPRGRLETSFSQYLTNERGLRQATLHWYLFETRRFLLDRFRDGPVSLGKLSRENVMRFVLRRADSSGPRGVQRTGTALRSFFRFLLWRGDISTDLAAAIPKVANRRSVELPKYLSAAQVELLLKGCESKTDEGRRDRAILLLLARLGLRGGEVVHMTLDDIDWDAGELLVCGKGGRYDRLPIPADAGEALATYLHVRPVCSTRRVFIRLHAPYRGLAGTSSIGYVVRRALARVGLDPDFKGTHLLRHSLATRMLRGGASLTDIGKILRHQMPNTTAIYAKVDLFALRALAQPWPGDEA